jgi:hypothetical protein
MPLHHSLTSHPCLPVHPVSSRLDMAEAAGNTMGRDNVVS